MPRKIKKRSDYIREHTDTVKVPGEREPTSTGYRVSSFKNGSFETFYEVMMAGTSTNRYRHEKKDKVVWVLAGQGFLELQREGETSATKRLVPGDHVAIPRGSSFRITTTSKQTLEMLVTQQAKYEAKLEVVEELETICEVTAQDLAEPSLDERMRSVVDFRPRRGSKAAKQQVADRAARGREGGGRPPVDPRSPTGFQDVNPETMGFQQGKNARPTGGKFDDAGAG